jgi:hypothetical protein
VAYADFRSGDNAGFMRAAGTDIVGSGAEVPGAGEGSDEHAAEGL